MSFARRIGRTPSLGAAVQIVPLVAWVFSNGTGLIRPALTQTGGSPEKINFLLDFTPYGKHAPFYAALDHGFWKDAGFDATIIKGEGSATTVASYAAGAVDFAFADTATLILARPKGARVKLASVIHDKSLYAAGTL